MKTLSLLSEAMGQLLSALPVQPSAGGSADGFTLPDLRHLKQAERARPAEKIIADPREQLDLLLAHFLTPPASEPVTASPLSEPLMQTVAHAGIGVKSESRPQPLTDPVASLLTDSPKLQAVMASLLAAQPVSGETPQQQARLARSAAQDLNAIAPRQHDTTQPRATPRDIRTAPRVEATTPPRRETLTPTVLASTTFASEMRQPETTHAQAQPLSLPADTSEWGEKLTSLLKDRIHFQIGQQQQSSTIRLDPPSLGKLEIAIHLEAGKLVVHIGASQADVCRSLQQLSDNLRQQLTGQNFVGVEVNVSQEGQSQQQQERQSQQQSPQIRSAVELEEETTLAGQHDAVLIKV
ncbi:flagellar hook-length control protein FliK [Enterobacter sp. ENT03]|uniref:flagellar hook-length control protein FliK n=1 Tax=Enterobacter sp. ENT03 TaxID=2854780 RepID=UPI001C478781|nr:flagellar hook-length control protein FliK [Enterobacter sp. ENT03]MBV7403940.1 flagellar hook-length control protein FliK [Enterobacter sp. ENT03]